MQQRGVQIYMPNTAITVYWWVTGKTRLRNDLLCVEWDAKHYTLTHSLCYLHKRLLIPKMVWQRSHWPHAFTNDQLCVFMDVYMYTILQRSLEQIKVQLNAICSPKYCCTGHRYFSVLGSWLAPSLLGPELSLYTLLLWLVTVAILVEIITWKQKLW